MKSIVACAVAALTLTPALAVTPATPQPSVQAQIETLKQQVAALQSQVDHLKTVRGQQVCISVWCA